MPGLPATFVMDFFRNILLNNSKLIVAHLLIALNFAGLFFCNSLLLKLCGIFFDNVHILRCQLEACKSFDEHFWHSLLFVVLIKKVKMCQA